MDQGAPGPLPARPLFPSSAIISYFCVPLTVGRGHNTIQPQTCTQLPRSMRSAAVALW